MSKNRQSNIKQIEVGIQLFAMKLGFDMKIGEQQQQQKQQQHVRTIQQQVEQCRYAHDHLRKTSYEPPFHPCYL